MGREHAIVKPKAVGFNNNKSGKNNKDVRCGLICFCHRSMNTTISVNASENGNKGLQ